MQCPNCKFENMPGSAACGRCGGTLRIGSLAVPIEPPRATAWQKRLRRAVPWRLRTAGHRVREAATENVGLSLPRAGEWLLLLVPGGLQLFRGERLSGAALLCGYVLLFVLGIATLGTSLGNTALGLAVSLHALSVCNVVVRAQASRGPRITGAVAAALVVLACYGALSRLVLNPLLETRRMIQSTAPLLPGDILLIRRYNSQFADPQPGDVVAYRVNWTMGQPGRVVQFFGERIDRVLAMPGDRVEFRSGQMIVNGAPSPHRPLADRLAIEHEPIEIPPETYLIIPSTDPAIGEVALERALAQLWLVHRSSLTGRVLARHYPWSRFERF